MIRQIKTSTCIFLAASAMMLAGCGSHDQAGASGGGTPPDVQQAIQQNAAREAAAAKNMPMATQGQVRQSVTGANHP